MNQREARRLREADDTHYAVWLPAAGGGGALIHVAGYSSARVVQSGRHERLILTASEARLAQTDRAAFISKVTGGGEHDAR